MRKGAWLNRPVIVSQRPATNKYDVAVAQAQAVPDAIRALHGMDGIAMRCSVRELNAVLTNNHE